MSDKRDSSAHPYRNPEKPEAQDLYIEEKDLPLEITDYLRDYFSSKGQSFDLLTMKVKLERKAVEDIYKFRIMIYDPNKNWGQIEKKAELKFDVLNNKVSSIELSRVNR